MNTTPPPPPKPPLPILQGEKAAFAWSYAQDLLRHWRQLIDGTESKADALLRLTGGLAAGIVLIGKALQAQSWLLSTAAGCFALSALICLVLRAPREHLQPTALDNLIRDLHDCDVEQVRGGMAVSYWTVIEDARRSQRRKSQLLHWALRLLMLGVGCLIVSLFI